MSQSKARQQLVEQQVNSVVEDVKRYEHSLRSRLVLAVVAFCRVLHMYQRVCHIQRQAMQHLWTMPQVIPRMLVATSTMRRLRMTSPTSSLQHCPAPCCALCCVPQHCARMATPTLRTMQHLRPCCVCTLGGPSLSTTVWLRPGKQEQAGRRHAP